MPQFLFVLHLPNSPRGLATSKDHAKMIEWGEFDTMLLSSGLPVEVSNKLLGKPQRIALNTWLIPSDESAGFLISIQQIAEKFEIEHSAFVVCGEITSMNK